MLAIMALQLRVVMAVPFYKSKAFFFRGRLETVYFVFGAGIAGAKAEAGGGRAFGGKLGLVFSVGHCRRCWGKGWGRLWGGVLAVFAVEYVLKGELALVGLVGGKW